MCSCRRSKTCTTADINPPRLRLNKEPRSTCLFRGSFSPVVEQAAEASSFRVSDQLLRDDRCVVTAKLIVQADPEDMVPEIAADGARGSHQAQLGAPSSREHGVEGIGEAAEVQVEILGLHRPPAAQLTFQPGTDGPSGACGAGAELSGEGIEHPSASEDVYCAAGNGCASLDVPIGQAAREVQQHRTVDPADAPAQGAEPPQVMLDRVAAENDRESSSHHVARNDSDRRAAGQDTSDAVAQVAALNVGFDTDHPIRGELKIIADLAAADYALARQIEGRPARPQ
jgi:hypothetical protein